MYPRFATNPLREEMLLSGELEPTNEGYALAKIVSTRHCTYLSQNGGDARYKTLIPCNLFGRHDNFDPISGHMIPGVINRMSMAKKENMDSIEALGRRHGEKRVYAGVGSCGLCILCVIKF